MNWYEMSERERKMAYDNADYFRDEYKRLVDLRNKQILKLEKQLEDAGELMRYLTEQKATT